jgi:transcriptional regulator with XRE-family HTH domain
MQAPLDPNTLGDFLRHRRLKQRRPMRRFCEEVGIDASNYSKVERNLIVPGDEMLERIAIGLGIKAGSPNMQLLTDYAATARGRLPDDLAKSEELKALLPAFYQRLRRSSGRNRTLSELYKVLVDTIQKG